MAVLLVKTQKKMKSMVEKTCHFRKYLSYCKQTVVEIRILKALAVRAQIDIRNMLLETGEMKIFLT